MTGPLDGSHEAALVHGARAGDSARQDLAPLRDEALQQPDVLVVDDLHLLIAELAELAATEEVLLLESRSLGAAPPAGPAARALMSLAHHSRPTSRSPRSRRPLGRASSRSRPLPRPHPSSRRPSFRCPLSIRP